jgi:hypothetical protein
MLIMMLQVKKIVTRDAVNIFRNWPLKGDFLTNICAVLLRGMGCSFLYYRWAGVGVCRQDTS